MSKKYLKMNEVKCMWCVESRQETHMGTYVHRYEPIRMLYTQCIDKLMHPPSALQQWQTRLTNNRHYCRLPKQENVGKHTHTYTAHINIHTIHCTNDRHNAPMTDTIADSPKQKKPSGMPQARFQWKTTTKFEMPSAVQMIVPLNNLVFIVKQKNERKRNSIHKTEKWKNSEQGDSYENAPFHKFEIHVSVHNHVYT